MTFPRFALQSSVLATLILVLLLLCVQVQYLVPRGVRVLLCVAPTLPEFICLDGLHLTQASTIGTHTLILRYAHAFAHVELAECNCFQILVDGLAKTLRYMVDEGSLTILAQRTRGRQPLRGAGVRDQQPQSEPEPQRSLLVEVIAVAPPPQHTHHSQPTIDALLAALASGQPLRGSRAHDIDQFLHIAKQLVAAMSGTVTLERLEGTPPLTRLSLLVPYTDPTDPELEVRLSGARGLNMSSSQGSVCLACERIGGGLISARLLSFAESQAAQKD
jgi:hypothetical protein